VTDVVTALDPTYPAPIQNACSAAKKKLVGKKAAALLKCHAKNEKPPGVDPAVFATCLQKARGKFGTAFGETDQKYGGTCLTMNDSVDIEDKVDGFVVGIVCALDSSTCPAPTPTPTPLPSCPGPTPTPNPSHGCCVAGPYCADIPPYNAGDCMGGGQIIWNCFCTCNGAVGFP